MSTTTWGDATQYFFELTPDLVLTAVETAGYECTGRCFTLNSYENRVYEVELANEIEGPPIVRKRVAKFYRPGRWTQEQILEEHQFLFDLQEHEIPVVHHSFFQTALVCEKLSKEICGTLFFQKWGAAFLMNSTTNNFNG